MKKNVVREKSFEFAIRIIKIYRFLSTEKREFVLSKQLLRSGTSIGALIREADQAESGKDFIHKMAIAQKETDESMYWLELLCATQYLNEQEFKSIFNDARELMKLEVSILKTSKGKLSTKV